MSTSDQPAPKALLFDVFGTVVDWRTSIQRDAASLFAEKGLERDWEAFAQDWRALYQPAMQTIRSGQRGYVKLDVLHRENLDALLDAYGLTSLSEQEKDHLNRAWHRLDPWPDVVEGLSALKKRYILGTLSNGNVELMVNLSRHGYLVWDAILGSEPTQSYKPEADTYLKSMALIGLPPEECMMVAAHNSDLEMAQSLGMQTAYIARPTEYGDRQTVDFEATGDWTIAVNSMIELNAALA